MNIPHAWLFPSSIEEAKEAQRAIARAVIVEDKLPEYHWIGGMDVSNNPYDPAQLVYASVVVLSYPELQVIENSAIVQKQSFPYIPGLLGFREAPALVKAFQELKRKPDILMIDGHGISHPRGLGIASHIGVLLDIPTIGVAKSILIGHAEAPLPEEPGSQVPLIWKEKTIGMLVRTKARANPLIISVGHKITLETAITLVKSSLLGYRLPEPTRHAHLTANTYRRHLMQAHFSDEKDGCLNERK